MSHIGNYEIVRHVASGGMAEVFLAKLHGPEGFEKIFAVKRVLSNLASSPEFLDRFLDEARLAARLVHPNIVQIFELGQSGEEYFIAMEYIDGESLRDILRRLSSPGAAMPWEVAVRISSDVLSALEYAHGFRGADGKPLKIIHRDVSPHNIMVSRLGEVKLLDFGLAKAASNIHHTSSNLVSGKVPYMSPEQIKGMEIDSRVDIFSLGVVLYEICAGRRPFVGLTEYEVSNAIVTEDPVGPRELRPDIPEELERIILGALEKNPEKRHSSAREMLDRLDTLMRGRGKAIDNSDLVRFVKKLAPAKTDDRPAALLETAVTPRSTSKKRRGNEAVEASTRADSPRALKAVPDEGGELSNYKKILPPVLAALLVLAFASGWIFMKSPNSFDHSIRLKRAIQSPSPLQSPPISEAPPRPRPAMISEISTAAADSSGDAASAPLLKKRNKERPKSVAPRKKVAKKVTASKGVGPGKIALNVDSTPAAEVKINGVPAGRTPLKGYETWNKGELLITIENDEHGLRYEESLNLPIDGPLTVKKTLSNGKIKVEADLK